MSQRYRSRKAPLLNVDVYCRSWQTRDGGPWYTWPTTKGSTPYTPSSEEMWDTQTKDYFKLKYSNAILPVNNMLKQETSVTFSDGVTISENSSYPPYVTYYEMGGPGLVLGTLWRNKIPTAPSAFTGTGPSDAEVNEQVIASVADARQLLFDGLTFVAELQKTAEMLKTTISRYTQRCLTVEKHARIAYRTAKRKGLASSSSLSFAQVFADTWMEKRYGWTPLAFDVRAVYQQVLELERLFHRVKGYAGSDIVTETEKLNIASGQYLYVEDFQLSGGYHWRTETAVGEEYRVRASSLIELSTAFRVTTDPLITLYEMIPYSWMCDWFLNIGDLLRTFSPFALGDLRSCSVVVDRIAYTRVRTLSPQFGYSKWRCVSHTAATGAVEFKQTRRFASSPQAALSFRADINAYRALDLVALAIGRLRKFSKLLPDDPTRNTLGSWVNAAKDTFNPLLRS